MSLDSNPLNWKIGLVGYGEAGRILAELTNKGIFGERTEGAFTPGIDWRTKADRILAVCPEKIG